MSLSLSLPLPRIARLSTLLVATLLAPVAAFASVGLNKSFAPTNVSAGQTSTLTVILLNSNAAPATAVAFTDTLPGSVVIANPANASTTCVGGSVTATPGNSSFSFSGGTIPAAAAGVAGQCSMQVSVVSPTAGVYINTIPSGAVSSSQGTNPQNASATLTVAALRPVTGAKAFLPTNLHGNGTASTVTITLTNPNGVALTSAAFTDTLPAGLAVASPANTSTTCVGGTVSTGATSASLAAGTIPANGNCNVKFDVVASAPNVYVDGNVTNTIAAGALTTAQGVTNPVFSNTVRLQTGARVEKSFAPTPIVTGGTSTLTVTVRNFNATAQTGIAFTDTMPAGMTVAAPVTTGGTCTPPLAFTPVPIAGANAFTVSGGTLPAAGAGVANANCTATINVIGTNAGVNPVTLTNTIPVGNFSGVAYSSAGAGLVVNAVTSVGGSKSFAPATILQGQVSTMTITLTNSAAVPATITSFTDALTTLGASPQFSVAASPAATTTCGGVLNAAPGATTVTLGAGNSIPAAGNCTIIVPVQASATASTGARTNTIAQGALVTNQGRTQAAITGALTVNPVLSVAKAFAPATVAAGADTRLTITLTRAAGASALSGLAFTDTLPAAHLVSASPNLVNNCGGAVTANSGTGTVVLAGGGLAGGAAATSCTILVNITTPSGSAGAPTNTIAAGAVTSTEGFINPAAASAVITRVLTNVTLNKSFSPTSVLVGGTSTLTINVINTNANALAITGGALTDALPVGMIIATPPAATNSCGGALTAVAGASSLSLANGSIAANATCTITVNVVTNASGNLTNTLGAGAFTSAQGVTNPLPASATLAATGVADLAITKTDGVATVTPGSTTTYTIVAKNNGPNAVAGASVVDTPPAGVTFTGWTCVASAGSACNASGSGPINELVTLLNGGTATFTVTAAIAPGATGSITNTATVVAPATVVDTNAANNTASDTDTLVPVTSLAIGKTDGSATYTPGTGATYTITVTNAGPSDATSVTLADTLPAGVTQSAGATCIAGPGANCGAITNLGSGFSVAGAYVPASGSSLVYTVPVSFGAGMVAASITNSVTVTNAASSGAGSTATATDTDTLALVSDVAITKTDGSPTYTPGNPVTYTIVASNAGPSPVVGATVADTAPAAITSPTWTCVASAGSSCPASGSGNIGASVNLLVGGTATFTLTGIVSPAATGNLVNTATVSVPGGVTDPNPGNNSATDTDTANPIADLAVTKTDGQTSVNAGATTTYTITVTNNGPSAVTGATVSDPLPAGVASFAWTCAATAGSSCPASGSGAIGTSAVNLLASGVATFTVTAMISGTATGSIVNVVTATVPPGTTDPIPGNNTATDTDTVSLVADLAITKTDGSPTYTPGNAITYTIVASNNGPSAVTGATVADAVPAAITAPTWTCVASVGSACGAPSGSGNIGTTVDLLNGGTATFTLTGTVSAGATGNLVNTATVAVPSGTTDPTPGNNTATDSDTPSPVADLAITKTDGSATYTPGNPITYTIVASNNGPSAVTGATVADTVPAAITASTWTCVASAGSSCPASGSGNIGASVNLLVGGTATFTLTGIVSPAATGNLVNTATVAVPSGTTDPTPGNNSATDTDTANPIADLAITKTDGSPTYTPGNPITYTIVASNNGPSAVTGATVADTVPAAITAPTWTCVASVGSACGAPSGSGNIGTTVDLLNGGTATFTLTGIVSPAATGNLVNTATVAVPPGTTDPTPGNNSATDTDTPNPIADLAITKTDGSATYTPGNPITYTIVASNNGPSAVTGATVADTVPAAITSPAWTCVASAGSSCPASGSGNIGASVNLLVGGTATFTLTGTVSAGATGNLVNTATVTVPSGTTDPTPGNNTATDTDTPNPIADLAITKTDGSATYTPGTPITYAIVASNSGPSAVTGATVADTVPAAITAPTWTCVASAGSSCPASGSGNIGASVNLLVGGTATFTLTGTVSAGATGNLVNTATVAVPSGTTDPTPGNNTATDSDTPSPVADLAITKTDGSATYTPGNPITYTIVASNSGPSAVTGATVADAVPAAITAPTWTCVASAGSSCPASGSGNIGASVNLLVGGTATFTLTGIVSPAATGNLVNTATVAVPSGTTDPTPGNNSATDTDTANPIADLAITKTDGASSATAGAPITYTIVASNSGPSAVNGATVADTLPATITGATWTCVASAGSSCPASGSGNIGASVNLLVGGTATFTLTGTVSAGATGNLVNTATVAVPPGTTDPNPGNNSATDVDTLVSQVALTLAKTDGSPSYTPGGTATYTITVGNGGPSTATSVTLTDPLPAGVTLTANASCVASGTANCGTVTGSTGQTSVGTTGASIGAGAGNSLVFSVPVTFASDLSTDPLVNTATAVDLGSSGPGSTATGTDSDTRSAVVALAVLKDDGATTYTPQGTAIYVITVQNTGLSDATNVTVADVLPPGVTLSADATCAANGTSTCGTVTGAAGQATLGTTGAYLVPGGNNTIVFLVPVSFAAGMSADPLVNTATATDVATGATASGQDSDALSPTVTLAATKDDGSATYTPGGTGTYTIIVRDTGVTDALNVTVSDPLPAGVTLSANATCVAHGTSICGTVTGTSGQTSFGTTGARINAGAANPLEFTVPVAFASGMTANPMVNVVAATDLASGNSTTATHSDTLSDNVTLAVSKEDGTASYTPGGTLTYTVIVADTGLSDALNVTVTDPFPAGMTLSANATCVANGTSTCGTVTGTTGQASFGTTGARINAGAGNSLAFTVPVALSPAMTANPMINIATATDLASGTTSNAAHSDVLVADVVLGVTKTDGSATYTPGSSATYAVTVANSGLSDALDVTVSDPLPAGVTLSGNVTCTANGTSSCGTVSGTTGQAAFGALAARVDAGAANTLVFGVPVAFAAGMSANPLVNTASATDTGTGNTASGSDSDALSANVSLVVVKTDGSATYTPGTGGTYTVTVTNTGISDAVNVTVADALPAGVTLSASATCVATGTSTCGTVSGTTGQSAFGTTGARINAGAGNALTFTVPVLFASAMTTDPLVNTATATDVASGATGTGTDSDTLAASAGLGITKTDGSATYTPGGTATYTIVVSNAGPSAANSVTVTDALPAGVTLAAAATCVPTGVATCGAVVGAAGAGAFGTTGATIAAGVGNRLTFTVPVSFAPGMIANPLVNTVSASDPAAGAPVSASDSDVRQASADVGVVKTGPATIKPGAAITYTLLITNAGPSPADGAMFMDNVPGVITGVAASCGSAAGGASCGTVNVSGNSVSGTVPVLPVGGSVVITITGTVTGATTFTNTATVSPPPGTLDPNPGNSSSSATTSGVVGASPIPVDAPWALALLAMLLALAGARQATRARVRRR